MYVYKISRCIGSIYRHTSALLVNIVMCEYGLTAAELCEYSHIKKKSFDSGTTK